MNQEAYQEIKGIFEEEIDRAQELIRRQPENKMGEAMADFYIWNLKRLIEELA